MDQVTLTVCYFLHLIATVAWIGGLLLMVIVVWPAARDAIAKQDDSGALLPFLENARGRLDPIINLSLIVLIVTGVIQMSLNPHYDGLLKFTNEWTRAILVKHIAVIGMIIIGGYMQWRVSPALERAGLLIRRGKDVPDLSALQRRERRLTALNLSLGMLVLFCTAIATAQ